MPAVAAGDEDFTTGQALRFAWGAWKQHKASFFVLGAASVMLTLISQSLAQHGGLGGALVVIPAQLLRALVLLVLVRAAVRVFEGQPVDLSRAGPLIRGFSAWVLTSLAALLLVAVGLLLFVVPGVLAATAFFFVPVLAASGVEPHRAFHLSAALTRGHRLHTFALAASLLALIGLGLVFFGVGLVVTVPLSALAAVYACRRLQGRRPASVLPAQPLGSAQSA